MSEKEMHRAWRISGQTGVPAYVEWIGNGQQRGDRYSYTTNEAKAKPMTAAQCRAFCAYMRDCGTVGYWC